MKECMNKNCGMHVEARNGNCLALLPEDIEACDKFLTTDSDDGAEVPLDCVVTLPFLSLQKACIYTCTVEFSKVDHTLCFNGEDNEHKNIACNKENCPLLRVAR